MSPVKEVKLDDGTTIFIEIEEVVFPDIVLQPTSDDLPPGATPTGAADTVMDTVQRLRGTIRGAFALIHSSLKDNAPDEWGAELNIGFKGTTNPVPVLVSSEANASLKVHAKWVKPKQKD